MCDSICLCIEYFIVVSDWSAKTNPYPDPHPDPNPNPKSKYKVYKLYKSKLEPDRDRAFKIRRVTLTLTSHSYISLSIFSLCLLTLTSHSVFSLCLLTLSSHSYLSLFSLCLLTLSSHSVLSLCPLTLSSHYRDKAGNTAAHHAAFIGLPRTLEALQDYAKRPPLSKSKWRTNHALLTPQAVADKLATLYPATIPRKASDSGETSASFGILGGGAKPFDLKVQEAASIGEYVPCTD